MRNRQGQQLMAALEPRRLLAGVVFPADANVIDVTAAPWGAIPNDGLDDTAAIQAALDSHPSGNHVFYFPDGVYELRSTLRPQLDDGVTKRSILQGQSRDGTILKLVDNLNYNNAVIDFRAGPAQFFRNSVRDLTIDTGSGNPLATGLKFNASNQGTVDNVLIRSGDGTGLVGLDHKHSGEIGPNLVTRLRIEGFNVGIHSGFQTASQTYEHIELVGQLQYGWVNESSQTVFVRSLRSINSVPAIRNASFSLPGDGQGNFLLIDSTLEGSGSASALAAIQNNKVMYLKNVATPGYLRSLQSLIVSGRGNGTLDGQYVEEYWANGLAEGSGRRGGMYELFESPDTYLGLPVNETPQVPWGELSTWASPLQFGALPDDNLDDTFAIQAAIDSGATTVYLPRGDWVLNETLIVRGSVQRVIGTEARLVPASGTTGVVRLADGTNPVVVWERTELLFGRSLKFEHASSRTWVFNNMLGLTYAPVVDQAGDVYINDVTGGPLVFRNQNAWLRQINPEMNTEVLGLPGRILNDGGRVWVLGLKTENAGTAVKTTNGGITEVYGSLHVGGFGTQPYFDTVDASLFAAATVGPKSARETRNGETRSGSIGLADAYSAFRPATLWSNRQIAIVDNNDADGFSTTGTWTASGAVPGGFLDDTFLYAAANSNASATWQADLADAGAYEVFGRWVNNSSGQFHSPHAAAAPYTIEHRDGSSVVLANQQTFGGQWRSLGVFRFDAGEASVRLNATSSGNVIADGMRFVRRDAPAVSGITFDPDRPRQEVRVTFTRDVGPSLAPADFELVNLTTGLAVTPDLLEVTYDPGTLTATLTFPGLPSGVLPDGAYRLTVDRDAVTSEGVPMLDNGVGEFSFLLGDIDHSGNVGFGDLLILAQNFNTTGKSYRLGNLTYDPAGSVDFADLLILAQRFGLTGMYDLRKPLSGNTRTHDRNRLDAANVIDHK